MLDKRFLGLIIIVGLVAGLIGSFYTHLLHYIQHFMYAYSASDGLSFGQAVARVSPEHRLLALVACVFMLELSRFSVEMFFPISLAMGAALITQQIVKARF